MTTTFGALLRQLRRRAQMTQADLAAAVGYSVSFISSLEQNTRRPDVHSVLQHFVPALALQEEPHLATHLLELAAATQGDLPPTAALTLTRERRLVITETHPEPPTNLPTPPTPLIGREQTVKMLCDRLLGHQGRLLTLVGPPGVGKTRLALAVASHLQAFHPDGVYFVSLAPISDPTLVASALVSALAIVDSPHKPPEKRLIEFLRRKELLLLLDNFEQVSAAAPLVATLLAECPRIRILVTSRERLHLRAEQRYPVQPLEIAAACELFVQRAQAVDPAFTLTAENQSTIAAICQRLDCLPLALELSAVQVDLFSPPALLARLQDQPLDLLANGLRDLPVHHITLRQAIQRSYALLTEQERVLFRTLGVFVGSFELTAVTHFGFTIATLQAVISKSLVRVETTPAGEQRFLLLETIRSFALEQLGKSGELPTIQQHYACYFLWLAEQLDPTAESSKQTYWIQRLKLDYENIRAALTWTLEYKAVEIALRFAWALRWYWTWFDAIGEGRRWSKPIITLAEQTWSELLAKIDDGLDESSRQQLELFARALYALSEFNSGDRAEHKCVLDRCWVLNQRCGLSSLTPVIYHRLAGYHRYYGNYAKHDELHLECLQLLPLIPRLNERTRNHHTAWSFKNMGLMAFYREELDCAACYYIHSRQLFSELGNRVWAAFCTAHLSQIHCYRGQVEEAQRLLDQCWEEVLQAGQTIYTLWLYHLAGHIALRAGDMVKATAYLCTGLQLLPRTEAGLDPTNDSELCLLLRGLSEVALHVGQADLAALLLGAVDKVVYVNQLPIHPIFRPEIEAMVINTRMHLMEGTYQSAYDAGHSMTTDTVVNLTQTMLTLER